MSPLKLSDDELTAVMAACRPLDPSQRDEFLQAVAVELRKAGGAVGPGTVFWSLRGVAGALRARARSRLTGGRTEQVSLRAGEIAPRLKSSTSCFDLPTIFRGLSVAPRSFG